jgi:hypothetical protein
MLSSVEATLAGRLIPLLFNIAPLEDYPAARASAGLALRLSCVTYCHIRIKLAATSADEPAFLATLIELSVWSRQFRVSNEPEIVSRTKRLLDAYGVDHRDWPADA